MRRVVLLLCLVPSIAGAQGPIETRNLRIPSLAFFRFDPRSGLLRPGEKSFGVGFTSANDYRRKNGVREDAETERLDLRMRWGVSRGEFTLDVPLMSRGPGFQDPLIDWWHRAVLGLDIERTNIPYGRTNVDLPGTGHFGEASGIGDISGTFSRPVGPQAFWSVAVKLPTGNASQLLGSGAVDVGGSVNAEWKLGRAWSAYGTLGLVYQGRPTRLNRARRLVDQESLAIEYRANSKDSWVLQTQSEPAAIKTGDPRSDSPHRQLTLGYSRRLSAKDTLQAFFSEDGDFLDYNVPGLVNVAPDFTIGLRWTRRW